MNMRSYDSLYINGAWQPSASTAVTDVINPATESVCGRVPCGNAQDVDRAVAAARDAFPRWSQTPAAERARYIAAVAGKLAERMQDIGALISMEQGMPVKWAIPVQAGLPAGVMASYVERCKITEQVHEAGSSLVVREPVGVCAFINPWNYPLHQIVGKVAPALAAGCTMVVKPSQETPLNAFLLAEIMHEAGVPPGVFNLVSGPGRVVGEAMCVHPDVDMISITGSTAAGARVAELAAPGIKRVTQELGGKSANILLEGIDLAAAVRHGVTDVMLNSGQTCIALTRMFVPRACYGQAVELAKAVAENLVVGDPASPQSFMGPMVSAAQRETVRKYIRQGLAEGARLVTGGEEPPAHVAKCGYYLPPTIFADVCNDMTIAQEEIFGPVLCMIPYDAEAEAIAMANDSPFGLSGHVWAADRESAIRVARQLRTGQVGINGARFNLNAPFGGYKQSGNGRELGDEGLNEFLEVKAINC